jgi:hypothetical protein
MMSEDAERFAPLRKFMHIDDLVTLHDRLEFEGRTKEAEDVGDFLHKLGKGYFPWLLPMGPDPRIGAWLNQLAEKAEDERRRKLVKQWTDRDTQAYRQWLDTADEAGQAQGATQERNFSHETMHQVWMPCPNGTKMVNMTFPCEGGVYQSHLIKVPRTAPAAFDRGEQHTAEKISVGTAPAGTARRPTEDYSGLVRQMHWGLRRAGAEFEDQMARYEAVDQKAMARAAERERAQKRAFCPDFLNTSAWAQNGGEEDNDGSSSSHSMVANPGGTVVDRALLPHLRHVTRARAVRSDTPP